MQLIGIGTTIISNCILVLLTWYKTFQIRKDLLKSTPDRPPIACFLFRDGESLPLCQGEQDDLY